MRILFHAFMRIFSKQSFQVIEVIGIGAIKFELASIANNIWRVEGTFGNLIVYFNSKETL